MLDSNYGLPKKVSPVDHAGAPVVSYRNMQLYNYIYNYTVYHREPYQLTGRLANNIQKFSREFAYLEAALTTSFGTGDHRIYGSQFYF